MSEHIVFTAPAYWRWQRQYVASTGTLILNDDELVSVKRLYRRRRGEGDAPAVARVIAIGMLMLHPSRVRAAYRAEGGGVFVHKQTDGIVMSGLLVRDGRVTPCRLYCRDFASPEQNLTSRLNEGRTMTHQITEDDIIAEAHGRGTVEVVEALRLVPAWHVAQLRAILARVVEGEEKMRAEGERDRAAGARRLRRRLEARIAQHVADHTEASP